MDFARWGAAVALCALHGCDRSEQTAKTETARLLRAVEVMREAPNDAKGAPLVALRAIDCSSPAVCEYRDTCVEAYERHIAATDRIGAVRADVGQSALGLSPQSVALLGQAEQDLKQSKALTEKCVNLGGALARKYR